METILEEENQHWCVVLYIQICILKQIDNVSFMQFSRRLHLPDSNSKCYQIQRRYIFAITIKLHTHTLDKVQEGKCWWAFAVPPPWSKWILLKGKRVDIELFVLLFFYKFLILIMEHNCDIQHHNELKYHPISEQTI